MRGQALALPPHPTFGPFGHLLLGGEKGKLTSGFSWAALAHSAYDCGLSGKVQLSPVGVRFESHPATTAIECGRNVLRRASNSRCPHESLARVINCSKP